MILNFFKTCFRKVKRHPYLTGGLLIVLTGWWFSLPQPLFDDPTCTVLEDQNQQLLGARIAADGQWRFPEMEWVPHRFEKAITTFEDKRFFYHPGFDPIGLARAFGQNLKAGKIVSGGSTITMQVVRLARKGKPRTIFEKMIEVALALRLECTYSKSEILALYASHAPFGGNVVGLDAAAWRYFAKPPDLLSWSEAATLAVLPNSPALIHPGRNRDALRRKRNRLLDRLFKNGEIDQTTVELAKEEPLPTAPHALPQLAPHLLDRTRLSHFKNGVSNKKTRLRTTISFSLQQFVNDVIERHLKILKANEIHNLAVLITDVETGAVLAYAGNATGTGAMHGEQVDIIRSPRSTGSILKPLLYAMMLHEGKILPQSIISDVPMNFNGYTPQNYFETYDGVVPAKRAVTRSLNVPLVNMLEDFGLEKFHFGLKKVGLTTINQPADYYGLPLILGGAEATLWELTGVYASMARTLKHFAEYDGHYFAGDFKMPHYALVENESENREVAETPPVWDAAAIWFAFQAMQDLERPNEYGEWEVFKSSKNIAWKTGTSVGFRDAWAIGVTSRFAVGVWTGNADGEGRPGLVGVLTAAPVLFDIFDGLPAGEGFFAPYDAITPLAVCQRSGYRAGAHCPVKSVWVPAAGVRVPACTFHQLFHLDKTGQWQVNSSCTPPSEMQHRPFFILPALEEFYYKNKHPEYSVLPPLHPSCRGSGEVADIQLIYPREPTKIRVPRDLDGKVGKTIFKAAHRYPETTIHWHLDNHYITSTRHFHHFECNPAPGNHILTLVDENGNRLRQHFEIVGEK